MDTVFIACAVLGGLLFFINLVLQFLAGSHAEFGVAEAHAGTPDVGFKILSFQGLTAFFMMFGLVGLALLRQSGAPSGLAVLGGGAAGVGAVWVIGRIFTSMKRLHSSGTLDLGKAVGQTATVYLNIPPGGIGKVQVVVQEQLQIFDARSDAAQLLKTGANVRVLRAENTGMLVVEPLAHPS